MKPRYTVILEPDLDEGGFTVTVPALPGCITEGNSYDDAVAKAREAIAGYVEDAVHYGEPMPSDDAGIDVLSVDVEVGHLAPA